MAQTIQFRRGNEANLPTLAPGEPAITLDTDKLFIGGPNGNVQLAKQSDLDLIGATSVTYDGNGNAQTITTPSSTFTFTYTGDKVTKVTEVRVDETIETTFTFSGDTITNVTRTVI